MMGLLRKLFSRRDRLSTLACAADRDAFIKELGESEVLVFAAMEDDGIDPAQLTEETLVKRMEESANRMNERDSFAPFTYETNDSLRLPFFGSSRSAQRFAEEYSMARNRVYGFQVFGLRGRELAVHAGMCNLVLNDGSDDQYVLTTQDTELFRQRWAQ